MREAIQGMLAIGQLGSAGGVGGAAGSASSSAAPPASSGGGSGVGLSLLDNPQPFVPRPSGAALRLEREAAARKRKAMVEDESGERMPTCFRDEEFGESRVRFCTPHRSERHVPFAPLNVLVMKEEPWVSCAQRTLEMLKDRG